MFLLYFMLLFRTLEVRWLRNSRLICLTQSLPQIKISPNLVFLIKSSFGNSICTIYMTRFFHAPCRTYLLYLSCPRAVCLFQIHIKKQVSGGNRLLLWHPQLHPLYQHHLQEKYRVARHLHSLCYRGIQ